MNSRPRFDCRRLFSDLKQLVFFGLSTQVEKSSLIKRRGKEEEIELDRISSYYYYFTNIILRSLLSTPKGVFRYQARANQGSGWGGGSVVEAPQTPPPRFTEISVVFTSFPSFFHFSSPVFFLFEFASEPW